MPSFNNNGVVLESTAARTAPGTLPLRKADEVTPLLRDHGREKQSLVRLVLTFLFMSAYGFGIATFGIVTFPQQAVRMSPDAHDIYLAGLLLLCGVAQLTGPLVGYMSDRTQHRFGKRRPWMLGAVVALLPSLALQWHFAVAGATAGGTAGYFISTFTGMVSLCTIQAVMMGLIPDNVPSDQIGTANGVQMALMFVGSAGGFLVAWLAPELPLYPVYLICMSSTAVVSLVSIRERPSEVVPGWSWLELFSSFYVNPWKHPEFFKLWMSRIFYSIGQSSSCFMLYYFRDVVYDPWAADPTPAGINGDQPREYTALMCVMAQFLGAASAFPAGKFADKYGRTGMILVAGVVVAGAFALFAFLHVLQFVLSVSVLYGCVNGVYMVGTYSLAVDCIPNKEDAAMWLAVWDVAVFIGTTIGPVVLGATLFYMPGGEWNAAEGYRANAPGGYIVIMLCAASALLTSAILASQVAASRAARATAAVAATDRSAPDGGGYGGWESCDVTTA